MATVGEPDLGGLHLFASALFPIGDRGGGGIDGRGPFGEEDGG